MNTQEKAVTKEQAISSAGETHPQPTDAVHCAACGVAETEWKEINGKRGIRKGAVAYCCDGCLNGIGCRCHVAAKPQAPIDSRANAGASDTGIKAGTGPKHEESKTDHALEESFPASDPPAFTPPNLK